MPNENSLFYLALVAGVGGGQIMINKKEIVYAKNISATLTEVVLRNGEKLSLNLSYGDLMHHLFLVGYNDSGEQKP